MQFATRHDTFYCLPFEMLLFLPHRGRKVNARSSCGHWRLLVADSANAFLQSQVEGVPESSLPSVLALPGLRAVQGGAH